MSNEPNPSSGLNRGLTEDGVKESRIKHGENVLTPPKKVSLWKLYVEKYKDPIIKILLFAAAVSLVLAVIENEFIETAGIFLAIFLATTIGFYFERDAAKKFGILTALGEESPVKVRRNGKVVQIARREIVVGDIVLIEVGDEVPADGTLTECTDLQIDESSLTGEPIATKRIRVNNESRDTDAASIKEETGHHDKGAYPPDTVLRSTMVMNGRGVFRVTAVGDATEIGKVARSSTEITAVKTPLNMQLERLAKMISKWGFGISISAFAIFLIHDILTEDVWDTDNYLRMAEIVLQYFMMAVTLIVMAVPEGLPMAVTLSLALNMRRMLKNNNLVRRLHACETMGAVTVICTDKTGTLTQNRMEVAEMWECGQKDEELLYPAIALNTTAHLDEEGKGIGNPTESALLMWLDRHGKDYKNIRNSYKCEWQMPFSTERKYMATIAEINGRHVLFVKGAPEIVMSFCSMSGNTETETNIRLQRYQSQAMRTLAFAWAEVDSSECINNGSCILPVTGNETNHDRSSSIKYKMSLQAIAAIRDPIRDDVPDAVAQCRKAGIEVKIVTGDTSATAMEIARQIGIVDSTELKTENSGMDSNNQDLSHNENGKNNQNRRPSDISGRLSITGPEFAALSDEEAYCRVQELRVMSRARPTDKQRLVNMLQKHGEVVAVTGDGTNDAPALHHAHVGLSLGSGTSVAKEASDMTLLDDSFRSIVHAVIWGRSLYRNIQRFLFFQLIVNVTALLLVLGGSFIGTQMPLTVTQILWVNLIMDTFAAMALASLPPSDEVMREKPRSRNDFIINRGMWRGIIFIGVSFFIIMFAMLIYCQRVDPGVQLHELSVFFTTFVMLQFWNLFNAKALGTNHSAFKDFMHDKGLLLVLIMVLIGQWLIVTFGGKMFRTTPLSLNEWTLITAVTSLVMWIGEGLRLVKRLFETKM